MSCTSRITGLPEHNPKPSTERGKRRHNNRNDARKKIAESSWNKSRSTNVSRFSYELMNGHRPHYKELSNVRL